MIRHAPSKWGPIALVCRKCGKKLGGGFGKKNKHGLAEEVRGTLKAQGRRQALRLIETGCLGVCPKGAVAVTLNDSVMIVPPGTAAHEVIGVLLKDAPAIPPTP